MDNLDHNNTKCKKSADKTKIKNVTKTQKIADHGRLVPQGLGCIANPTHPTIPAPGKSEMMNIFIVQERLKQLSENLSQGKEKIKFQRGGGVDVYVNNTVKWPHEFVLMGTNKERITYDQLSPVQWMAGFCRTIRDHPDVKIRDHMLDYVIHLLDDAQDFSWSAAKAIHAVLLCRMEQGKVTGWSDCDKIYRIRCAHAQRHVASNTNQGHKGQDKTQTAGKVLPCIYFNKNTCLQKTHTRRDGCFIGTYVRLVFRRRAKLILIHRQTVENPNQKMSNNGHAIQMACPLF